MNSFRASLLILLAPLSMATAQSNIQTQSIIVNPVKSSLTVNIRTNRDPSGNGVPTYTPGDHLEFYTRVNQDAYVYLFNLDAGGQVNLLAENGLQAKGNFVRADTTRVFPKKGQKSTFLLTLPAGTNQVLALASRTPLNVQQISQFETVRESSVRVNATGHAGLAQALSIVVRPVEPAAWTTDTAQYTITHRSLSTLPALDSHALKTQTSFDMKARLSEVFAAYADQFRAEGYQLVKADYDDQGASGLLARGGQAHGQLELAIKEVRQRFFVTLTRRN